MATFSCFVLSCASRGFARGRSPVLTKCLKLFIASEVNSEAEQSRGRNPLYVQGRKQCVLNEMQGE